ncbi:hypothetical protein Zmor_003515 [Zophobas morio]|uniref:Uncharacterized protein n=1 Tax=Zophobas morio TaxID=2755281 RepID=A0AA38HMG1_9CUCU|nr:hypothetical protein Zmor_003515 [Zophobas morio]
MRQVGEFGRDKSRSTTTVSPFGRDTSQDMCSNLSLHVETKLWHIIMLRSPNKRTLSRSRAFDFGPFTADCYFNFILICFEFTGNDYLNETRSLL